jgi:hypothetical protein
MPEGQLWVDVEAFEQVVATVRRSRDPAAYRAAIRRYAGELLPEECYEEWADNGREGLRISFGDRVSEAREPREGKARLEQLSRRTQPCL